MAFSEHALQARQTKAPKKRKKVLVLNGFNLLIPLRDQQIEPTYAENFTQVIRATSSEKYDLVILPSSDSTAAGKFLADLAVNIPEEKTLVTGGSEEAPRWMQEAKLKYYQPDAGVIPWVRKRLGIRTRGRPG